VKRASLIAACLVWLTSMSFAAPVGDKKIISYGKDLTPEERILIFRELPLPSDVKSEDLKSIEVSNEEEWKLLKGLVPESEIGTKSISSVYIEKLAEGQGLKIETKNLTFVTPQMFGNALATAGVKDAAIYATSPKEVSGTAALTGIYKAIESLTGKTLKPEAKQIGAEELVQTGKLGEKVGKERAALLVARSKERMVKESARDITQIVNETAKEQNITLSEEERNLLVGLLKKVKKLNLNVDELQKQLKNFQPAPETVPETEPQSWLDKVIEFFRSIFVQLFSFVGQILKHSA
jgi:uncharacterized protein YpuA (DUF1002 family)